MIYGYGRVSTEGQNLDMQKDALKGHGCDDILFEKMSGSNRFRPVLIGVIQKLKKGDTLVVYNLSRLSRSMKQISDLILEFAEKQINLVSIVEKIDLSTPMGRAMVHIQAAFAQMSVEIIRENTKEGLRAAKFRGVVLGRRHVLNDIQKKQVKMMYRKQNASLNTIAKTFNIGRTTAYNYAIG